MGYATEVPDTAATYVNQCLQLALNATNEYNAALEKLQSHEMAKKYMNHSGHASFPKNLHGASLLQSALENPNDFGTTMPELRSHFREFSSKMELLSIVIKFQPKTSAIFEILISSHGFNLLLLTEGNIMNILDEVICILCVQSS